MSDPFWKSVRRWKRCYKSFTSGLVNDPPDKSTDAIRPIYKTSIWIAQFSLFEYHTFGNHFGWRQAELRFCLSSKQFVYFLQRSCLCWHKAKLWCELLPSTSYNNTVWLTSHNESHHFSVQVSNGWVYNRNVNTKIIQPFYPIDNARLDSTREIQILPYLRRKYSTHANYWKFFTAPKCSRFLFLLGEKKKTIKRKLGDFLCSKL